MNPRSRSPRAQSPLRIAAAIVAISLAGALALTGLASSSSSRGQGVMIGRGNSALSAMLVLEGRLADPSTASNGSFAIGGSVTGLYPGGLKWLGLTIANPQTFTIVVTSITTVVKATRASCPAGYLSIGSFAGHHWVAARGASHVAVPAKMAATAPNACNGARFTLTYRGLATKANR